MEYCSFVLVFENVYSISIVGGAINKSSVCGWGCLFGKGWSVVGRSGRGSVDGRRQALHRRVA